MTEFTRHFRCPDCDEPMHLEGGYFDWWVCDLCRKWWPPYTVKS